LLLLIFLATLFPYLLVAFFRGIQDLFWLIFSWSLFFVLVSYLPKKWAGITPIVIGFLLAFPLSNFAEIWDDGYVWFHFGYDLNDIPGVVSGLTYYLLLTASAFFLWRSIREKGQTL